MGLLSWLNQKAGNLSDISIVDRGYARGDRVEQKGAAASATVVGIEYTLDEGTTKRRIAVSDGTRVSGIEVGHGPAAVHARVRLGVELRIRSDGDKVVLDWPAMGVPDGPPQKARRKAPEAGVTDKAVSSGDQRKLKKWAPRRATIVTLSRRDSAFGPTLNFDVTLRLDDGATATAGGTEIPFYAAWFAAPGAEVPVAVDAGKAVIDWAAAANEPRPAGGLEDPPPAGSAASLY